MIAGCSAFPEETRLVFNLEGRYSHKNPNLWNLHFCPTIPIQLYLTNAQPWSRSFNHFQEEYQRHCRAYSHQQSLTIETHSLDQIFFLASLGSHIFSERARSRGIPKPRKSTEHHATNWLFSLGNLVMNPWACLPAKSGYHTTSGNTYAGRRGRYHTELKAIWHRLTTPAFTWFQQADTS